MTKQNLVVRLYHDTAINPRFDSLWILLLLSFEVVLSGVVLCRVAYTEIDWRAYMQQVTTWWDDGEYDYRNIRGDTGPLVYPAGFLYLFQVLRVVTNQQVAVAQVVFAGFYVATQAVVLMIYQTAFVQQLRLQQQHQQQQQQQQQVHSIWLHRIAMATLCLSKRLHSIFLLRLFNDGPTMLLLYVSIYLFMQDKWNVACVVFSLAVSIKMNVLLFAPGLLLLLLQRGPNLRTVIATRLALCCALPQIILGAPFLLRHPVSYLRKAFELDRVFFYKWTVNWKMVSEQVFVSKPWAFLLLAGHLGTLAVLAVAWIRKYNNGRNNNNESMQKSLVLSPTYIAHTMCTANFVGIVFARTLHYQFYAWYFHALPMLLLTNVPQPKSLKQLLQTLVLRMLLPIGALEIAFLTFPATPTSSTILQVIHFALLALIRPAEPTTSWTTNTALTTATTKTKTKTVNKPKAE